MDVAWTHAQIEDIIKTTKWRIERARTQSRQLQTVIYQTQDRIGKSLSRLAEPVPLISMHAADSAKAGELAENGAFALAALLNE
jgi:hypothetical protein